MHTPLTITLALTAKPAPATYDVALRRTQSDGSAGRRFERTFKPKK